jgi:hypothetical protein
LGGARVRRQPSLIELSTLLLQRNVAIVDSAPELVTGQSFPAEYKEPLISLWHDPEVQRCYERGNEAALPEK